MAGGAMAPNFPATVIVDPKPPESETSTDGGKILT
jgi:hypothetical protein